jgi:hypothetical protein
METKAEGAVITMRLIKSATKASGEMVRRRGSAIFVLMAKAHMKELLYKILRMASEQSLFTMRTHIKENTPRADSMVRANISGRVEIFIKASSLRAASMGEEYGLHLLGKCTRAATS